MKILGSIKKRQILGNKFIIKGLLLLSILFAQKSFAQMSSNQSFTQTIKGRVIDKQTQATLPGATVLITTGAKQLGAVTDEEGYFKISGIEIGRVNLTVDYLGYFPAVMNNLYLSSGKELVLDIEMEEQVIKTEEVVILAKKDKTVLNNDMVSLSGRTFTIEESQRYAGARNDVGRMAANYAGVSTSNDAVNDIVIRGNSPNGLLWRLEGVEIPNPNHFGGMGATGGPVGMLNNNVLSNSDFITSAFPAEYGNALSGAFDIKMRNGNYEKHEFLGQIGFNGFEFGAEGPISKNSKASYLINARYSTLEVLSKMGVNFGTGTAIPKYADLTFKVHIPTKSFGIIDMFGLGGINSIEFINSEKDTTKVEESLYEDNNYDIYSKNDMGVIGLSHTLLINPSTYSKLTFAFSRISNHTMVDSVMGDRSTVDLLRQHFKNYDFIINYQFSKKFNVKHNLKLGAEINQKSFRLIDSVYLTDENRFRNQFNEKDNTILLRAFAQWQFKPIDKVVINTGVHFQELTLNNNFVVEPRFGIKWFFVPKQSLSFGYGLHSRMAPIYAFFQKIEVSPNNYIQPNKSLDFIKSQHFVLGYDWNIGRNFRLKAEAYYQDNFQAIVEPESSSYSILNTSSFNWQWPDTLVNGGNGRNYGVELTLEKFLDKGFYFLFTSSLFDSKYRGQDNILRSTAFDSKYVVNLLAGKEFELLKKEGAKYHKWITIDGKVTVAGGQKYTPINLEESRIENETVYYEDLAFSEKFKDYFRADIRLAFRLEGKRTTQEWAFDIQNVSNTKNPLYKEFNTNTGDIKTVNQLGIFPMMQYRITF